MEIAMNRLMVANVVGRSQHADRGVLATQPYAAGGAHINRTSDYCGGRRYGPKKRLGEDADPYTRATGPFLVRTRDRLAGNHRMRAPSGASPTAAGCCR
jgi:deoxyribodipyrimidine photolyase-related protein